MNPKISYTVETKFWRKKIGNKLDFIQSGGDIHDADQRSVKEFRNDSPSLPENKHSTIFKVL